MAQERGADQQASGPADTTFRLTLTGVDEIGEEDYKLTINAKNSTSTNKIVKTARERYGNGVWVHVRYQGKLLPQNKRVRDLGIQGDAQLYMEKVEYKQPEEAPKVKTDYEPLDQEHDEPPKRDSTPDTKKQINQLWKWYRNNNMQQVSHIGDEATDNPWKQLHGIKKKKDLAEDPELLNHLAALHDQYLNGFDGPAKRQRTV